MKDLHLKPLLWPLPGEESEALLVTCYEGEPDFLYHYHPQYELTLTLGTAGRRLVGGNVANYAWKELVLLGPNLPHTWAAEPFKGRHSLERNCVIHFTRESLGLDFLSRKELKSIVRLMERAEVGLVFSGPAADEAARLMENLDSTQDGNRMIAFLSIMQKLAVEACAKPILSGKRSPMVLEEDCKKLASIVDYIRSHSHTDIPLSEIAAQAAMSVPTFCRFFRRATGTSFVEYLNEWRVSRACALLEATTDSILEISERCGFNNLSHFNRQFLRRRGTTPSAFRARSLATQDANGRNERKSYNNSSRDARSFFFSLTQTQCS